jgi:hypothetical protein
MLPARGRQHSCDICYRSVIGHCARPGYLWFADIGSSPQRCQSRGEARPPVPYLAALSFMFANSNDTTPLPAALVVGPALTRRQIFFVITRGRRGQPGESFGLICTRCRSDVKNALRCRACGALCPTSEIAAAILSPNAFAFYVLFLMVVAIFWFT